MREVADSLSERLCKLLTYMADRRILLYIYLCGVRLRQLFPDTTYLGNIKKIAKRIGF